jgi:hypothetical protein
MYRGTLKRMGYDYQRLERDLLAILVSLHGILTESESEEVRHFVEHGEYGVALETLSGILEEGGKRISFEAYEQIHGLGERMEMEPEVWERLRVSIAKPEP